MPPKNPLEIPEITDQVASLLQCNDLARCVRVSKNWRDIFLPHRWRTVRVGFEDYRNRTGYFGPKEDDAYNHRYLIQDLCLMGVFAGLVGHDYPNLRRLWISRGDAKNALSLDLIKMSPFLVHLDMAAVKVAPTFWEALSSLSHIRSLYLYDFKMDADSAPRFWQACKQLENLEMMNVTLDRGAPRDMEFNRLRTLSMMMTFVLDEAEQLSLALQSPNLETFEWDIGPFTNIRERTLIHHPIQSNHWRRLNKLHMGCDLQNADLASILEGIGYGFGNVIDLRLGRCQWGAQTSKAITQHFSTLVKVDLAECYSGSSSSILDMLCCCPRLEVLLARNVSAREIAARGPWVCQQLQELRICFQVGESDLDLCPLVFKRLSTLTRLERLDLWFPNYRYSDHGVLKFRLDCGMEHLASLRQLSTLRFFMDSFHEYIPQFGMDEVAWIVDNWKKLKRISGCFNSDPLIESEVKEAFESSGVTICQ
ncbi:hypothetical protein BGX34_005004 [Mortierella sp. NVP85]|nr:hypothetical protein BGX34_005004 [Mortierella sp. NVP85]